MVFVKRGRVPLLDNHGLDFEKVVGATFVHHSTSISRMAPGLARVPVVVCGCGIHDGNQSSGIKNGGGGGMAVGGIGVAVVGGFIGGFSCPVVGAS